jgi:triosephosphate isomerase
MKRAKIIAGNWKMNLSLEEAIQLTQDILAQYENYTNEHTKVLLSVPFVYAHKIAEMCAGMSNIYVGVQNMYYEKAGAFTGEISPVMLKSIGIQAVIIGHSERRTLFHENNELLAKKVKSALEHSLIPIFCVGETLQEYEQNITEKVIQEQIRKGLFHLNSSEIEKIIIAYEPVWAIGTGKNATPEYAEKVHQQIRKLIQSQYNIEIAEKIPVLYGGSMKPDNSADLLEKPNIDGGLIGGASLKAKDFIQILQSVPQSNV